MHVKTTVVCCISDDLVDDLVKSYKQMPRYLIFVQPPLLVTEDFFWLAES